MVGSQVYGSAASRFPTTARRPAAAVPSPPRFVAPSSRRRSGPRARTRPSPPRRGEIYSYRARVGGYDFLSKASEEGGADDDHHGRDAASGTSGGGAGGTGAGGAAGKPPSARARERFVVEVQARWSEVMASDVGRSGAVSYAMVGRHADTLDLGVDR